MSNFELTVRTPAHFGSQSFGEAVASANFGESNFYDKSLTELFFQLHLVQGISNLEVNLLERIPMLAKNAEPMTVDAFADAVVSHLFSETYFHILSLHFDTFLEAVYLPNMVIQNRNNPYIIDSEVLLKVHAHVNALFNAKLQQWSVITKGMDKLNASMVRETPVALSMDTALARFEEASRKGKVKDIAAAERAIERANTALASIAALQVALDAEFVKLAPVREEMVPLRLLEDVTRSLKSLAVEGLSSTEVASIAVHAIGSCVRFFPHTFEDEVKFADSLLRP